MPVLYLNTDLTFLRPRQREAVSITREAFDEKIPKTRGYMDRDSLTDHYPILEQDLKAVRFDFENWEYDPDDEADSLMGWQQWDNGLAFMGMYAHGDWEIPVFFVLYWDGNSVRAYTPLLGNTWNPHTGMALGSGMESLSMEQLERYKANPDNFKNPDTWFLEQSLGGPIPDDFDGEGDIKFHWPSIKFDLENTFAVKHHTHAG